VVEDFQCAGFGAAAVGFLQQDVQLLAVLGPASLECTALAEGVRALVAKVIGGVVGDELAVAAEVAPEVVEVVIVVFKLDAQWKRRIGIGCRCQGTGGAVGVALPRAEVYPRAVLGV
jgi:hypothetical protein